MRALGISDLILDYYYVNDELIGVCGGMSAHNIIANLASLGVSTKVIGCCGKDVDGDIAIRSLDSLGVDTKDIIRLDISTKRFYVHYQDGKCIKRSRASFEDGWYMGNMFKDSDVLEKIKDDDILVFDMLTDTNIKIIATSKVHKVIDLGQTFSLDNYGDDMLLDVLRKISIINLHNRVYVYLLERFKLSTLLDLYQLIKPKLLIVTNDQEGASFAFNDITVMKSLEEVSKEVDDTGSGDAFFAMFIFKVFSNNLNVTSELIDDTFIQATKITAKVVSNYGARGHLQPLYKV